MPQGQLQLLLFPVRKGVSSSVECQSSEYDLLSVLVVAFVECPPSDVRYVILVKYGVRLKVLLSRPTYFILPL